MHDQTDAVADEQTDAAAATRVVLSYPEDLSEWGRWQLDERSFKAYLRKTSDDVAEGDVWEVFLDVGCCGNTLDLGLHVVEVEGGDRMAADTEVEYVTREACDIRGGWEVQSAAGPGAYGR